MNIMIPINEEKNLCSLKSRSSWAIVTLEEGNTEQISFYENKEKIKDSLDYVVLNSKDEPLDEFFDDGIDVLIAPIQKTIDDIIEAYMFRELHEVGA